MYGLTSPIPPERGIFAGKFGYSGKMVIRPFSIPDDIREKCLRVFFKYVTVSITGCWVWEGRSHNGYASCPYPGGNTQWAHRISYALFNGPIEAQRHIDHKCRNRLCVNPAHLKQMTPIENYWAIQRRRLRDEKALKEKMGQLTLW